MPRDEAAPSALSPLDRSTVAVVSHASGPRLLVAIPALISRLAGQRFHDVSCGMRCYSRAAALQLHLLGRFTYTQEVARSAVRGARRR